jgi:hypothetical protein
VYPYESRLKWLLSSRYNHILRALELAPHGRDSLLHERAASLHRWDRVRTVATVLLSVGFAGTAVAIARNLLPGLTTAAPLLTAVTKIFGALTGLLTLVYLFLTRLLSQIEADMLMILVSTARK